MIRIVKYLFAIALPILYCCSCTQQRQPCLTPKTASLSIRSVKPTADKKNVDTPLNAAVFAPITNILNVKGTLYSKNSKFTVSLSPQTDTCSWLFAADTAAGSPFDTITFRYERRLNFISNACGYSYLYEINTIGSTHHIIDSVFIENRSVTNNVNINNIQVFIHPRP